MIQFKIQILIGFLLLGTGGALEGCAWLTGEVDRDCDVSPWTSTYVQNATATDLEISFCSPDDTLPENSAKLAAQSTTYHSLEVRHETKNVTIPVADSCRDQGYAPSSIGTQIPVLKATDAAAFHICYSPHANFTEDDGLEIKDQELYEILPVAQGCPSGFTDPAQAGLACHSSF